MEYTVLQADGTWDLSKEVNRYIQRGWEPQGGLAIQEVGFRWAYHQAMVKED